MRSNLALKKILPNSSKVVFKAVDNYSLIHINYNFSTFFALNLSSPMLLSSYYYTYTRKTRTNENSIQNKHE